MAKAKNPYLKNPYNYVGGKHRLLPQILPLFPKSINIFYDIFSGGGDVFLNVQARHIIANDICSHLKAMNDEFKSNDIENILVKIQQYIDTYSLSKEGVNAKENYLKFREDWNNGSLSNPIAFYTLLCYAFNNQIRFNNSGLYNMPAGTGRSHFNPSLKKKLIEYCNKIQSISIDFSTLDFKDILIDNNKENFIYADPPYILSMATYNENGGWNLDKEKELLAYLKQANEKGIKFALSNLLETKGNRHPLLEAWVQKNNCIIHYLDMSYKNVSYNRDNTQKDIEVLITNY